MLGIVESSVGGTKPGGSITASMTCTTPLTAYTSASVTLALSIDTVDPDIVTFTSCPSRVLTCSPFLRSAATTSAETTWYFKTCTRALMFAGLRSSARTPFGKLSKAASVGAKTVNGPLPDRTVARLAFVTAATRVLRPLDVASSGIVGAAKPGGINTLLM